MLLVHRDGAAGGTPARPECSAGHDPVDRRCVTPEARLNSKADLPLNERAITGVDQALRGLDAQTHGVVLPDPGYPRAEGDRPVGTDEVGPPAAVRRLEMVPGGRGTGQDLRRRRPLALSGGPPVAPADGVLFGRVPWRMLQPDGARHRSVKLGGHRQPKIPTLARAATTPLGST